MNNIVIMAFTAKGHELAQKIASLLPSGECHINVHRISMLRDFMPSVFRKGNILVFVGAVGIAVRAIAGLVKDKTSDPAVIVVDEGGRFVIPILSGHIGGANQFAQRLSGFIQAVPVITTATDINGVFSVDCYAVENGYAIINPECIKHVSSALLDGHEVGLCTPFEICGPLPEKIKLCNSGSVGILIASEPAKTPFEKTLRLMPKCFHVGIGAKKNINFDLLRDYFLEVLSAASIPVACISSVSSIDLKKNENAIIRLAENYGIPFITYPASRFRECEHLFEQSAFVREITGVGNICETAAYFSSFQGEIVVGKKAKNGITIAIAKEAWRVRFED